MKKFRRDVFGVVNAGVNTFKEYFDTYIDASGTINYAGQRYVSAHANISTDATGKPFPAGNIHAYLTMSCMNNCGVVSPYTYDIYGQFVYGGVWINNINYTTCTKLSNQPSWYYYASTQNGMAAINQSNYEINRPIGTSISVIGKHLYEDESINDPITRRNDLIYRRNDELYGEKTDIYSPTCHINLKACIINDFADHSHDKIILGFDSNDTNTMHLINQIAKTNIMQVMIPVIRSIGIETNEVLYSRNTPELNAYNPAVQAVFDAYANSAPDWDGLYVLPCTDSNIRMVLEIIRCGGFFNMISKEESDDILKRFDSACTPDQDVINEINTMLGLGSTRAVMKYAEEHNAVSYLNKTIKAKEDALRDAESVFNSTISRFKEYYTLDGEDVANKYWESLSKKDPDKYTDELKHEIIKKIHESDNTNEATS